MKLYLAGPMTGLPELNFPAFRAAAQSLRLDGHEVFNPAETDGGDASKPRPYYMRIDFKAILDSEGIVVLEGWQKSSGATVEVAVARQLGLPVMDLELRPIVQENVDSERTTFATGAVRCASVAGSNGKHPARYDLITPIGLRRLAETYGEGALKYTDNNWKKGIPAKNLINHAMAHIVQWLAGDTSEDHLAHAAWNLFSTMHFESERPELIDVETRKIG